MDGVRSTNIFEALNQPSKSSKDSTEKAPAKSAEKKAKKAEAAKAQPAAAAKAAPVRTGNKRGGLANKGTRPGSAAPGTRDNRNKRVYDRQSEQSFQKNHGGARKGGLHQGGNTDLKQEAVTATEEHNAGATDAATEGKDATDVKVEVKEPEKPDPRKTLAQFEAEQAARAVAGDVLTARAAVVGKEFKAGAPPKKNKAEKESLFSDVKADAEAKKAAESAKDAKPAKKAGKESKTKAAAAPTPAPKPQKLGLDQFNDTVKPPPRAEKREDAKPAAAAASTDAPKAGASSAPRGGRGGARGGRGGARGRRGGAPIDLATNFPPLGAKA
jgi:hypothetical protein